MAPAEIGETSRGGEMVYTEALRAFVRKNVRVRLSPAALLQSKI